MGSASKKCRGDSLDGLFSRDSQKEDQGRERSDPENSLGDILVHGNPPFPDEMGKTLKRFVDRYVLSASDNTLIFSDLVVPMPGENCLDW